VIRARARALVESAARSSNPPRFIEDDRTIRRIRRALDGIARLFRDPPAHPSKEERFHRKPGASVESAPVFREKRGCIRRSASVPVENPVHPSNVGRPRGPRRRFRRKRGASIESAALPSRARRFRRKLGEFVENPPDFEKIGRESVY
jgi:hypothetical protein